MLTKAMAQAARHGQTFHHVTLRNADGTPLRVRVNGKVQTWKTRPDAFRLPVKHGMYAYGEITQSNAAEWLTDAQLADIQAREQRASLTGSGIESQEYAHEGE